ncbi:MAG: hypothetical protein ABWX93_01990 [Pseudoxanthomonas sp.]
MRLTRPALLATLLFATLAGTVHAGDGNEARYLELTNRAYDSITSLEVAPAGTTAFQPQSLGAPLRGGGGSTTVKIVAEGCVNDFRFRFGNGSALVYRELDICTGDRLSIRPLPRPDRRPREARYVDAHTR